MYAVFSSLLLESKSRLSYNNKQKHIGIADSDDTLRIKCTTISPAEQFIIEYNNNGTISFKSVSNKKYVTKTGTTYLRLLNTTKNENTNFILSSASSTDPNVFWIQYNNNYRGWTDYTYNRVAIRDRYYSKYRIGFDIYGASANRIVNNTYSWNSICLKRYPCGGVSDGGQGFFFRTVTAPPSETTVSLFIDNVLVGEAAFGSDNEAIIRRVGRELTTEGTIIPMIIALLN